ncbi:SEC14 cytosolic factor family protein / phosphoglyceride transfer family protein [Zea mays]|uniref:SEC14 cytosolic factor family protein / phosphoglyceride transfer family protein n=1 Tax=Zea mays TaxID=4577 RepID=A0A1D6M8X2_MAIZE|nr:SEC14 cytosolic factor family protein / phosphoglyceride transfer family protein [Zea mays]AQK87252.1 SEC14 cytosolic factor family protein / phosphoglyceride transfer family protein [Zea mays]AQK87305.1 SEC14 cytosolic factor family protein / phosphoglyceride transfer family protein [Zea mays]AQK87309.1 SEC14 cytosolic factor family protein / phosphoglyceride transfer family protein [Zea mays]AQK87325.1 SEC14 cytosolic factor family protein / phosphoglyceride transfer family protein [Zea ma
MNKFMWSLLVGQGEVLLFMYLYQLSCDMRVSRKFRYMKVCSCIRSGIVNISFFICLSFVKLGICLSSRFTSVRLLRWRLLLFMLMHLDVMNYKPKIWELFNYGSHEFYPH